jgi:GAF domain-containing protein
LEQRGQRAIDIAARREWRGGVSRDSADRRATTSQKYAHRYNKLLAMLGDLAATRSQEQVVMVLRRSARAIAGADGITIIRRKGERVHYIAEDAIGPLWSGQDFPIEACISGIAILENQPIIIPDIYADPRVPIEAYRPTFVRSMAMLPIGQSAPKWAMGAYWSTVGAPAEEAMTLLGSLARAAASSFEPFEPKG